MKYITNNTIAAYITKLNAKKYGHAELVKKVLTVTSFIDWLSKENKVSKDDAKRFSEQLLKITHTQPVTKPSLNNLPNKGKFPLRFVGYILIALTVSILGAGIYNRFFLKVKTPLAYSTTPIQAGRTISFQGRLTDSLGNPITAPIDITYNFYTTATGGIPITGSTRVCTANGDVDGVFSSLIGNDAGPSCNTELPASIFTENPTVYLGVKVGSEPNEMSPRQQIANVGYAINAETLQGMPPGQSTSSVPFINKDGDLLVAVSNPGIRSTFASANFTISSAQATTIQSAGSGDITLSATQGGALRFNTYYGTLGERMTILANGNVGIGNTTPSMALDIVGSATTSGNLSSGGQVKLGELTSAPTSLGAGSLYYNSTTAKVYYNNGTVWTEVGAGAAGSDLFQRTLGSLAPTNITDAINTGAIATGSALVHLPGTNNQNAWFNLGLGNLGIGTITPTNYVEIQGNTTGTGGTGSVLKIVQNGTWTGNSPYALDVSGYTNLNGFRINAADGVRALYKTAAGGSLGFATTGDDPITFTQSTSTERMRIAAGGNVGIGTTVPGAKLDVLGNLNVSTYATVGASLALGTSTAAPGAGNLDMSGNLTFAGALKPAGNAGTSGQFLTSGGAGTAPAWTSTITATSVPFSGITSATNTTAAMVVGAGGSLNFTSTGTINASSLQAATWAAPGAIGTTTPAAGNFTTIGATTQGTGAFTTLSANSFNAPSLNNFTATNAVNSSYNPTYSTAGNYIAYSPIPKYLWHDRLAFNKAWGAPTFETYDGASWSSSAVENALFAQQENQAKTIIDGTTKTAARWTWNNSSVAYSAANWWVVGVTYTAVASNKNILIESSADGSTWTTRYTTTGDVTNYSPLWMKVADNGGDTYFRITITVTNAQPLILSSIKALSARWGNQGGGSEQEFPYVWDSSQNIAFGSGSAAANGIVTIGTNTTAATGGLYFGTDTSLYRSGANQLKTDDGLIVTGNMGVGATAPTAKLDILGNLNVSTYATVGASLALGTSSAAAGAGNLDMSGNLTFAGALKPAGNAGTSGQYLMSSGAGAAPSWTSSIAATSLPFSGITSGTNTTAAMVVGAGGSLNYTSTGTINASTLIGGTWAAPGAIGTTTPAAANFTTIGATTQGTGAFTTLNATTGFQLNGTAASGNFLRGNGTNFVSSGIQVTDVPTLNQNTTGSAYYLNSRDTRAVNDAPQDYGPLIKYDFKSNSTNGLSDGGSYNGVMTWRKYGAATDFTGGPAMQLAYSDNGNLWTRVSTSSAYWSGTWSQILNNTTGVKLQATTPGTQQVGNVNISGTGLFGGNLNLTGAFMPGGNAGTSGQFLTSGGPGAAATWTSTIAATSIPFSGITSGTNTTAAMVVGNGASLNYTGTGTINASSLIGGTWAAPGAIGGTTANTGKFTTLEATSTGNALTLSGVGANIAFSGAGLAQITTATNQHLALMPAGTGNVGIGTSSPAYLLDVNGSFRVQNNGMAIDSSGYSTTPTAGSPWQAFTYSNPQNIIPNGDLESWTAGASTYPDGFVNWSTAPLITRESAAANVHQGNYSSKIVANATGAYFIGLMYNAARIDKNPNDSSTGTYTISFWYKQPSTNTQTANIGVYDTAASSYALSSSLLKDDAWHFFSKTFSIRYDSNWYIRWSVASGTATTGDTLYTDAISLTKGSETYQSVQSSLATTGNVTRWGDFYNMGGNVGVGTISPAAKLDVLGNLNVNTYATVSASLALGTSNASAGAGNLDMSGNLTFAGALKPAGNAGTTGQFLISGGAGAAPTWTSTITATSIPFSGITSGTNTTAAMVVGNGASLNYTGTGTINASSLIGGTWAAPGAIGGTTANTGAFTTLSASSYATVSASLALGTSTAAAGAGNLSMSGNLNLAGAFMPGGTAGTSGQYLTSAGPGATPTWTSTVGASTVPFSGITNGTNTTAAMVVGAGGSLNYTSTGTINASTLIGGTWAAPGAIGGTTANTGKFTTLEATSTGNALTLSGVGANIAFSGAGLAQITTATNQHLALMPAGTGNVGVGKSAPTAKLDVLGNLNVSTYATMGASLALGTSNASAGAGNLDMSGNLTLSGAFKPAGNAGTAGYFLASSGTGSAPTWTSTIGASTVPFSGITGPSTNTTAAMTVGTGASLNYTGTGTINASSLIGGTWAAPGAIGTTTPAAANFTTIGATTQGTGKFTTLEATSTGNALTLSGAGANIAFSGAGLAQITTATNQHLALMPAGTGNVGIGTTSPGAKLQVEGDTRVRGNDVFFSLQNTAGGSDWHLRSYNDGSFAIRQQTGGPYDRLTVLNTGNVGIGATSPTAKLDILGNLNVSTYATVGASLALGTSNAAAGAGNLDMSGNLTIAGAIKPGGNAGASGYILTSSGGGVNTWTDPLTLTGGANVWQRVLGSLAPLNITDDVNIGNTATGSALVHLPGTNNQNAWFNLGTGNLGVGTASPSFKFEVNSGSDVSVANFKSTSASNQAAIWLQNTTGGISLLGEGSVFSITDDSFGKKFNVDVSTGNVGIGTTNLTSLLSIGSTNITANPQIAIGTDLAESNYAISVSGGRTMFGYDQIDGSSVINSGGSKGFKVMVNGTNNSWLSGTQAFTVASDGNVGIGVSNPTSKLEIAGASSTISNASGDIAINAASGNVSFSTNNLTNITNLTTLGQVRIGQFSTPPVSIGAGSLYYNSTGGKIYYNNGAAWVEVGASFWQQTLGSLAPTNITNDINTGSTATASALVHLPGTTNHNAWLNLGTGNVGIGTTTPTSAKLQVNGTIMGDELIDTAGGGAYYVDPAGTSVLGGNVYIASTYGVDTTAAGTLYLGNTNSSVIAIGTSATARTLTLGNTTGATALALNSGTGGITLNSTDVIDLNSSKAAGGGATEAFSLKTSTDLGATDELFQLGDSLADMITVLGNGYVGIGTSTPGTQLQVHEPGTGNSQLTVSTDSDTNNSILAFTTDANGTPKDARIGLDSANGVLKMVYGSPFASSTNGLVINSSGNIGIGTVNPLDQVEIANTVVGGRMIISNGAGATRKTLLFQAPGGTYNYARLTAHDYGASTGINLALQDTGGNVGIGTTTPTGAKLQVVGAVMADQFTDTTGSGTYYMNPAGTSVLGGNIEMRSATPSILGYDSSTTTYYTLHFKGNSGDAVASISVDGATSGSGKIDVGTVDPPYTIDGKKYATYQPSMTGVKEETTGVAHLTQKNSQLQAYTYTIDFNNQTEGSDLWLFNKTSNLKQNIKDMTVLLSSASNGKTWYNVDKDSQQLTFFSSSPTDISYRLTAPRFDSSTWKNERDANDPSVGFVINSDGTLSSPNTTQVAYTAPQLTQYANNTFALVGDFIDEFINVNKALIANIKSGFIEAEDIVINNTLTARETLTSSLTASVARIETLVVSKKINTPSVETVDLKASGSSELPSISTNTVKPIEKDVTVDLSKNSSPSGSLARLVINGLNNAPVAQIDAAGNATLAGTLVADQVVASSSAFGSSSIAQLKTDNASVSGTLIAKEVQADNINNSLQQFSSSINGVQQQLAALQNAPLPNAQYYQKLDDSIIGNITITDTANIYKATISDSLMVGSVLVEQNSLLALSSDLKISSLSTIHLFDDVVVIAKNGNVAIKGEVSASSLAIKNVEGTTVASVDASGSAHFNEVIAKKFTLDKIATNGAVIADSGMRNAQNEPIPAIKTDAEVAGTGSIPQDAKEVVIYNDNVTENSLIYLTPTSDTVQNQLSVTKKTTCSANTTQTACTPYFVISSNSAIHPEAPFNWLIIN